MTFIYDKYFFVILFILFFYKRVSLLSRRIQVQRGLNPFKINLEFDVNFQITILSNDFSELSISISV